jgi:hypothetical protein
MVGLKELVQFQIAFPANDEEHNQEQDGDDARRTEEAKWVSGPDRFRELNHPTV